MNRVNENYIAQKGIICGGGTKPQSNFFNFLKLPKIKQSKQPKQSVKKIDFVIGVDCACQPIIHTIFL
jgi:nanoRNase/pAp phosphatase (c-di-AMP/oligoRNAs hydrolase)